MHSFSCKKFKICSKKYIKHRIIEFVRKKNWFFCLHQAIIFVRFFFYFKYYFTMFHIVVNIAKNIHKIATVIEPFLTEPILYLIRSENVQCSANEASPFSRHHFGINWLFSVFLHHLSFRPNGNVNAKQQKAKANERRKKIESIWLL